MSHDIEHRACFDLPAPGSIIDKHYVTEHHASDSLEYLLQGKNHLPKTQDFINKIFDGFEIKLDTSCEKLTEIFIDYGTGKSQLNCAELSTRDNCRCLKDNGIFEKFRCVECGRLDVRRLTVM